ncbi:MAG: ABC transporter ATP-binding protein, partial [Hyphomicrobiales bacterium]
ADSSIESLDMVPGNLPDLTAASLPACRYAGRCPLVEERCFTTPAPRVPLAPQHFAYCWSKA